MHGDGIFDSIDDKDINCNNDEPEESVVETGTEEGAELDLKSQDKKTLLICILCCIMNLYSLIIEIQYNLNKLKLSS